MKTLTEFATIHLKNAHAKKQELTASGKTAEELPAAMGEALKLEGDKLTYMLAALDVVGEKMHDLKRVIVSSLNEGESAPSSARLVGEKYYSVEYYTSAHKAAPEQAQGGRGDRRDGKGGNRGGGKPGERGGRGGGRDSGRGDGRNAGGGGGAGGDRGAPRGPKPAHVSTGRLPVPNKSSGGLPTPNKPADAAPPTGGESGADKT